jgi:dipeptidyl aminopeptidase/acylaminoacyl peptidase
MLRASMYFLLSALLACYSPRSEARPWSLTDIAPLLSGTDTIEVASTGAVLFNDHYSDLKHDSVEQTWLLLDSNGAISEIPRRLQVAKLHWAPDGRRLAALLEQKDGTQQLFWMDPRSFAVTPLTHGRSISNFSISPDGTQIAAIETPAVAPSAAPRSSFWFTEDTDMLGRAPASRQLMIIDAASGVQRRAIIDSYSYGGPVTDHDPSWSSDGMRVAVVRQPTALYAAFQQAQYVAVELASGSVRPLSDEKMFALPQTAPPLYSGDGHLATVHTWDNQFGSREDLFVDGRNVSAGFDHDFWSCGNTQLAWAGNRLLASTMDGVDLRLYRISTDGAAPVSLTPKGGSVNAFSIATDGAIYLAYSTPEKPGEIYRLGVDGSMRQLTHRHVLPTDLGIAHTGFPTWNDGHGHMLVGQLTQAGNTKSPLMVEVHGGPQCADTSAFSAFAQYFATNGYSYFRPSPRGSDGYGDWSYKALNNDWGPGPMADVMAGVDAVASTKTIDAQRLFLYGASYGGYLASWIVTHTDRFHAAVAAIPVTDLLLSYTLTQSPNIERRFFGQKPIADNQEVLMEQSPVRYARSLHTPLLLVAGLKDTQAPYTQTIEFFKILREEGKDVALLAYPQAGHGPDNPLGVLDWTAHLVGWFAAHGGISIGDAKLPPNDAPCSGNPRSPVICESTHAAEAKRTSSEP